MYSVEQAERPPPASDAPTTFDIYAFQPPSPLASIDLSSSSAASISPTASGASSPRAAEQQQQPSSPNGSAAVSSAPASNTTYQSVLDSHFDAVQAFWTGNHIPAAPASAAPPPPNVSALVSSVVSAALQPGQPSNFAEWREASLRHAKCEDVICTDSADSASPFAQVPLAAVPAATFDGYQRSGTTAAVAAEKKDNSGSDEEKNAMVSYPRPLTGFDQCRLWLSQFKFLRMPGLALGGPFQPPSFTISLDSANGPRMLTRHLMDALFPSSAIGGSSAYAPPVLSSAAPSASSSSASSSPADSSQSAVDVTRSATAGYLELASILYRQSLESSSIGSNSGPNASGGSSHVAPTTTLAQRRAHAAGGPSPDGWSRLLHLHASTEFAGFMNADSHSNLQILEANAKLQRSLKLLDQTPRLAFV